MNKPKCVMRNCGATGNEEPKRALFAFPIKNKEKCLKWVEACENEEVMKSFNDGFLSKNARICGLHFPVAYRLSIDAPKDVDPISYSKCKCADYTHTHCYGDVVKYINCEHSYMKKKKVGNQSEVEK